MIKNTWWKWLILAAAILASAIVLNFGPQPVVDANTRQPVLDEKGEPVTRFTARNLRYGLDIQGGYSFTLELDKDALRDTITNNSEVVLTAEEVEKQVEDTAARSDEIAAEIIRKRIDPLGTEEPIITRGKKDHRIYVQLAGADEQKRAKAEKSVRSSAFLEFRLLHPRNDSLVGELFASQKAPEGYKIVDVDGGKTYVRADNYVAVSSTPGYAARLARFEVPNGSKAYQFMLERTGGTDENPRFSPVFVKRTPELTGANLDRAEVGVDQFGRHEVSLKFDSKGSTKFGQTTSKNIGQRLAIVLDGTVYSSPQIQSAITGGNAQITGSFTREEAVFLRNILNAGALPAPMKFVGQRFVSPTVGEDALAGAAKAIFWGVGAIVVFMIVYYGACGIVADIAFLINIILLALGTVIVSAVFSVLDPEISSAGSKALQLPVLTLPGIAGILLTFGMAVDANVLTFERTREELASGKSKFAAIMAGYDRAFLAILDSNLTTVLTAVILFAFGSGAIRGFAITLTAGIIVSMFTVLVVTKLIFLATVKENSTGSIKMLSLIPSTLNIDFVSRWKKYGIAALAIVIIGFGLGIVRGVKDPGSVFAVDFTGGSKISYKVTNPETVEGRRDAVLGIVRQTFATAGVADANPQFQNEGDDLLMEVKTVSSLDKVDYTAISQALTTDVPETSFEWLSNDEIGSQIGQEFKRSAVKAVIFALIGMILYITIRFEFGFALGALAALVHDVLVTLGIYLLMGRQISLITVAAILTIVGYSVNDTIVIFDRIREELRSPKSKALSFAELANRCINTTLSRTALTSLTTAFTVFALLIFSSGDIRDFAVIMLIGIILGTLSTIFIANPIMLLYHKGKRPDLSKKND